MPPNQAAGYRKAAEYTLEQLDWCIGYLHRIGKVRIARQLAKNRRRIAQNLTKEPAGGRRPTVR